MSKDNGTTYVGMDVRCETCRRNLLTLDGRPLDAIGGTIGRQIERHIRTGEWEQRINKDEDALPSVGDV